MILWSLRRSRKQAKGARGTGSNRMFCEGKMKLENVLPLLSSILVFCTGAFYSNISGLAELCWVTCAP